MSDELIEGRSLRGRPFIPPTGAYQNPLEPAQVGTLRRAADLPPEMLPKFRTNTGELQPLTDGVLDEIESVIQAARVNPEARDLPADFWPEYRKATGEQIPLTPERIDALREIIHAIAPPPPARQRQLVEDWIPTFRTATGELQPITDDMIQEIEEVLQAYQRGELPEGAPQGWQPEISTGPDTFKPLTLEAIRELAERGDVPPVRRQEPRTGDWVPMFRDVTGEMEPITDENIARIEALIREWEAGYRPPQAPRDWSPSFRDVTGDIEPLTSDKLDELRDLIGVPSEPPVRIQPQRDEATGGYAPLIVEEPELPILELLPYLEDIDTDRPDREDATGEYARLPRLDEVVDADWVIEVGQAFEQEPPTPAQPIGDLRDITPIRSEREPVKGRTTHFLERIGGERRGPRQLLILFGIVLVVALVIFVPLALSSLNEQAASPPPTGDLPAIPDLPTEVGGAGPAATAGPTAPPYAQGRIAFATDRDGNFELYVLDMTTQVSQRITSDPGDDREPAWSPDGAWLAFVSDRGGSYDIYVLRPDGSDLRRLTTDGSQDHNPAWTADGSAILFSRETSSGSQIMRLDTACLSAPEACEGSVTAVTADGFDRSPDAAPGGTHIAYTTAEFAGLPSGVAISALDGSGRVVLQGSGASDSQARWSNDGARLVFVSNKAGAPDLWAMAADGGEALQVTRDPASDVEPDWAPDGKFIVFASDRGAEGDFELYLIRSDCRDPEEGCEAALLQITNNQAQDINPAWTP